MGAGTRNRGSGRGSEEAERERGTDSVAQVSR